MKRFCNFYMAKDHNTHKHHHRQQNTKLFQHHQGFYSNYDILNPNVYPLENNHVPQVLEQTKIDINYHF